MAAMLSFSGYFCYNRLKIALEMDGLFGFWDLTGDD
jgi:hypothetical protein